MKLVCVRHSISGMNGKSQGFWIPLAGLLLMARLCEARCLIHDFDTHVKELFLKDHWFQMRSFTPTGEKIQVKQQFLSVLDMVCSSLLANAHENEMTLDPINGSMRDRIVWIYEEIVKNLANAQSWTLNNSMMFCRNHVCSESYGSSFINITQFEKIYTSVCDWNQSVPECPMPHNYSDASATVSPIHNQCEPIKSSNVLNESQNFSYGLVMSVVINIILSIHFVISITIFQYQRSRPQPQDQLELQRMQKAAEI